MAARRRQSVGSLYRRPASRAEGKKGQLLGRKVPIRIAASQIEAAALAGLKAAAARQLGDVRRDPPGLVVLITPGR
jgi:hypothetical protein